MHSAPPQRRVDRARASTNPGAATASVEPELAHQREHAAALRARRRRSRPAAPAPPHAQRQRGHERRHALLRDVAAGEHDDGSRVDIRLDLSLSVTARVLAREHRHLAAQALLAQPRGVQAREAERPLAGCARRPAGPASRPSRRRARGSRASTRASTARASRPRAGSRARRRSEARREQARSRGTRRCGRRRSAARAAPGARSTPAPEDERRPDPPPARRACRAPSRGPAVTTRTPGTPGSAPRGHWRSVR